MGERSLDEYVDRRDSESTPEPEGSGDVDWHDQPRIVIQ